MAGGDGNLWITAVTQNAGKARRGREWVSNKGNLFASLLLVNDLGVQDTSTLPFVASLAVAAAIEKSISVEFNNLPVKIKWPNDVLFNEKKISGILLEASITPTGKRAMVIGCGINCAHSPKTALYLATSLHEEGYKVSADALFLALSDAMHHYLSIWNNGAGFAEIRRLWLNKAIGIGEMITARFDNSSKSGKFVGIDQNGRLILADEAGETLISAADIFFGPGQKNGSEKHEKT